MNRREFLTSCSLAGSSPLVVSIGSAATDQEGNVSTTSKPRIRSQSIRLELKHAWTIARGTADFKENVLVFYERDGLTGMGEAGHLTAAGQTAAQTLEGVQRLIPLYETVNPFEFAGLPEEGERVAGVSPPARAALEMALLDWVGQKLALPLHRLFGLNPRREVATSFTVGLDKPEVMQQKVREAAAFRFIKVKLGRPDDEEIIKALRVVTDKPIRVDANEGWPDQETAIKKIAWLEKQNIELVEQPLPRRMIAQTRWLKERTPLPLVADESVAVARDLPGLAGAFTGVNIKIMKAGGVLEALRMFQLARVLSLETMLGCMIETSIAISAAVQLQSLARWVDLDGSLLLKDDPFEGPILKGDCWEAPTGPGLGVRTRPKRPSGKLLP